MELLTVNLIRLSLLISEDRLKDIFEMALKECNTVEELNRCLEAELTIVGHNSSYDKEAAREGALTEYEKIHNQISDLTYMKNVFIEEIRLLSDIITKKE